MPPGPDLPERFYATDSTAFSVMLTGMKISVSLYVSNVAQERNFQLGFKVHMQNFSEVLTIAGCGVSIYLWIKMEAYHIFYNLTLLLQDLFYSLLTLLH